jgi:hypothetical protein
MVAVTVIMPVSPWPIVIITITVRPVVVITRVVIVAGIVISGIISGTERESKRYVGLCGLGRERHQAKGHKPQYKIFLHTF